MRSSATAADRLLILHEDPILGSSLADLATGLGFHVHRSVALPEALEILGEGPGFATVMIGANGHGRSSDPRSPDRARQVCGPVREQVAAIRQRAGAAQILIVAERGMNLDRCRDLVTHGVNGFIELHRGTPDRDTLRSQLARAKQRFERTAGATPGLSDPTIFETMGFVGCSRLMSKVLHRAVRAAQISDVPVLIYGESGTGKQLLAETIHRLDPKRSRHRLIAVNCAALTETLADSALFGHKKGAYTGATEDRRGYFRAADEGTVLLDEIGELDACMQPKLLRVLQEGLVLPVGSDEEETVDVRLLAASNRHLEPLVEQGAFRLDLFQRLNVITIEIPPLRSRPEDIPLLVRFFLKRYAAYSPTPIVDVDEAVYGLLASLRLEGNVRELENLIRRVLAFKSGGDRITVSDVTAVLRDRASRRSDCRPLLAQQLLDSASQATGNPQPTFTELLDECERLLLSRAIAQSPQSQADLARTLGLSRRTLYNKRRKHRL